MPTHKDEIPTARSILWPVLIAVTIQILMTAATTAARLRAGRDDTDIYFRYATLMGEGKVPYRDFRVEYPPLALPLFLAAGFASDGVAGFKVAVAVEMLIFNAATVWLVAGWVGRRQGGRSIRVRLARYTILYLLLSRLMVLRYDAATMFVGFARLDVVVFRTPEAGWSRGGAGHADEGLPRGHRDGLRAWDLARRGTSRGRGLAAFGVSLSLGALAWLVIGGPRGVVESLGYQLGRGFEYGSLYSGLQMLAAKAAGAEIAVVRDHAAWASVTPWSSRFLPMVLPVQAATILGVCGVFIRRGMIEGVRFSGEAILAFIITGKVFSPQYLIWLLPFIAVMEGPIARRGFWLFAAGCAATLIAPALTGWFPRTGLAVILAYNLKNALFLALLAILTFGPIPDDARRGR